MSGCVRYGGDCLFNYLMRLDISWGHALCLEINWRRGRDSNSRNGISVNTISNRAPSATRPPLRRERSVSMDRFSASSFKTQFNHISRLGRPLLEPTERRLGLRENLEAGRTVFLAILANDLTAKQRDGANRFRVFKNNPKSISWLQRFSRRENTF
jgi:hypothetical protein